MIDSDSLSRFMMFFQRSEIQCRALDDKLLFEVTYTSHTFRDKEHEVGEIRLRQIYNYIDALPQLRIMSDTWRTTLGEIVVWSGIGPKSDDLISKLAFCRMGPVSRNALVSPSYLDPILIF